MEEMRNTIITNDVWGMFYYTESDGWLEYTGRGDSAGRYDGGI